MNCGSEVGSCQGGDPYALYDWIKKNGGVPFDTCLPYESCSYDVREGNC